jgi:hypothetical protein
MMAPPHAVKDKHIRLQISPALNAAMAASAPAQDFTPRCHPDSAAIPDRSGSRAWLGPVQTGQSPATTQASSSSLSSSSSSSWRNNIVFKAMGWNLKESCDRLQLLAGDRLDIAYSLGMNDHPEFGGLELTLHDLRHS